MKYLKKFESLFNQRMGDKLWVEFDSTHEPYVNRSRSPVKLTTLTISNRCQYIAGFHSIEDPMRLELIFQPWMERDSRRVVSYPLEDESKLRKLWVPTPLAVLPTYHFSKVTPLPTLGKLPYRGGSRNPTCTSESNRSRFQDGVPLSIGYLHFWGELGIRTLETTFAVFRFSRPV